MPLFAPGLGVAWASNRRIPSETIPEMYSYFEQVGGIFSKAVAKQLHAQAKQRESLAPVAFSHSPRPHSKHLKRLVNFNDDCGKSN